MDNFCEQLVTPKKTSLDICKKAVIILATISLSFLAFWFLGMLSILVIALFIYLCIFLCGNYNYEFEYIFTNGDLDVDKIIAKRKRKRVLSASAKSFTAFGKYNENLPPFQGNTIRTDANNGEVIYYAEFKSSNKGNVRLIFSPNDHLLDLMKHYIPRSIYTFKD